MRLQVTFARIDARAYMYGSSLYKAHSRWKTRERKKMCARVRMCRYTIYIWGRKKKKEKKGETEASGCFRRWETIPRGPYLRKILLMTKYAISTIYHHATRARCILSIIYK